MSLALQEYLEIKAQYDECHKLLAPDGGKLQMPGRLPAESFKIEREEGTTNVKLQTR